MLAVACDASEERRLKLLTARMATYLQAPRYGELLFEINGWDPQGLAEFRAQPGRARDPGRDRRDRDARSAARDPRR